MWGVCSTSAVRARARAQRVSAAATRTRLSRCAPSPRRRGTRPRARRARCRTRRAGRGRGLVGSGGWWETELEEDEGEGSQSPMRAVGARRRACGRCERRGRGRARLREVSRARVRARARRRVAGRRDGSGDARAGSADRAVPTRSRHGSAARRSTLSGGARGAGARARPRGREAGRGVVCGRQVRRRADGRTSRWPAPTSMQRNVRVCSSFVSAARAAKDAANLGEQGTEGGRNADQPTLSFRAMGSAC